MSKLSLDRDKVDYAKRLAEQIVTPVQHFIDRHTTDSIERSVLRLMGVSGPADLKPKGDAPQGRIPLVNALADAMGQKKLALGAGYWLGLAAAHQPNLDSNALARGIISGKIKLDDLGSKSKDEIDRACGRLMQPQLDRLRQNRENKSRRPDWHRPSQPLKYVIVATGNIHEDVRQAQAAVQMGADIIAVIRSTAQSLLDYVPEGETTEGFGGTFATQENFRLMREALDESEKKYKRRVGLCNYSSGLCMPEIAVLGALEGVDYLLNDAMYGILFRDINMQRNFVDQFFSRRICALSGITIQTGEDNYLTTAESFKYWFQVLASHFVNQAFAKRAGIGDNNLALGHAFEMDPNIEDSILYEWAQAQLVRELFPRAPIKFMPPTKHKDGDIFFSYLYDGMFNLAGAITGQTIQLLGMHTEAIHNPYVQDRYLSLKNAKYIFNGAKNAKDEIYFQPNGKIARRARQVLDDGIRLLKKLRMRGMLRGIEEGAFANVRRSQRGGKGIEGVFHKDRDYFTPLQGYLTPRAIRDESDGLRKGNRERRRGSGDPRRSTRLGDRKSSTRARHDRNRNATRDKRPARSRPGNSDVPRPNARNGGEDAAPRQPRTRGSEVAPRPPREGSSDALPRQPRNRNNDGETSQRSPRSDSSDTASRSPRNSGSQAAPRTPRSVGPDPVPRGPRPGRGDSGSRPPRNGARENGYKKGRAPEKPRSNRELSEADLQRQFHQEILKKENGSSVSKAPQRRPLSSEKTPDLSDPETTQKVFPNDEPAVPQPPSKPRSMPRRPLAEPNAEKSIPRRGLKVETELAPPKPAATPVEKPASYQPLPRRQLKIQPDAQPAGAEDKKDPSNDEEPKP